MTRSHTDTTVTQRSQARRWQQLISEVQDILVDALHSAPGLRGQQPQLHLLLDARLLNPHTAAGQNSLRQWSQALQSQGVPHRMDCPLLPWLAKAQHTITIRLY